MCVACMDGKLADRKGYEFMRKLTGATEAPTAAEDKVNVRMFDVCNILCWHMFDVCVFIG